MEHFRSKVLKLKIFGEQIFVLKIFLRQSMAGQMFMLCTLSKCIFRCLNYGKMFKKLVTKQTLGQVKNRMFEWKFSKVLEILEMCQDWNETSGQDCSGYLSHLQITIRCRLYYA